MAAEDIAVETQGLTKIYGSGNTEVVAMRDVTFCVRRSGGSTATLRGILLAEGVVALTRRLGGITRPMAWSFRHRKTLYCDSYCADAQHCF